ncbi:MAG: acetylornithine deacetylase [Actinophytocola sp.]|uniref:acetylornithine deacetylase n=1 Tax=Actinophytocola sp. TaxID=1872138 RepID=UPI003D6C18B9
MVISDELTIDLLRILVAFDTTSATSNLDFAKWVAGYLRENGAWVGLNFDENGANANVLACFGPPEPGGVVLSAHTDVVPVEGQRWMSDPFRLTRRGDRLHGRGTADMKGFIAVCLAAAPHWGTGRLRRPIHLAFSHDEEIGCVGAPRLVDDVVATCGQAHVVIVGEPTGMRVADRHRGYLAFQTTFYGHAAHSSDPSKGSSAVQAAARFVELLADPELGRAEGVTRTTVNIGRVTGGTGTNVVPERCVVDWELRPAADADIDELRRRAARWTSTAARDLRVESTELVAVPPLRADDDRAVRLVREFGLDGPADSLPYGTEAGYFQAAGMPTVICGPGSIEQAHQPDEWIDTAQLGRTAEFLMGVTKWAEEENVHVD